MVENPKGCNAALLKYKVMSVCRLFCHLIKMNGSLEDDDDNSPKNTIQTFSLLTCRSKPLRSSSKLKAIFNILFLDYEQI